MILRGEQDALFAGVDGQQRLAAAIPGAQLTVYPETGHSPNWERPECVAADLEGSWAQHNESAPVLSPSATVDHRAVSRGLRCPRHRRGANR